MGLENHLAHVYFRLRIYESNRDSFQDLINQLYTHAYGLDFDSVRPSGSFGDKKNDGYFSDQGIYLQVYGPDNPSLDSVGRTASNKLDKDFRGLMENIALGVWPDIQEYQFIINDNFLSPPATLLSKRDQLFHEFNCQIPINIIGARKLELLFGKLSHDQKETVLNKALIVDEGGICQLEMNALSATIDSISKQSNVPIDAPTPDTLPKVERKIEFNHLTGRIKYILQNSLYEVPRVEHYLAETSIIDTEIVLSNHFQKLYAQAKKLDLEQNKMFLFIFNETVDLVLNDNPNGLTRNAISNAAYCLMAKFFECCDIFEKPPKED